MGGKQSVHIETPEFNPNEWQYLAEEAQIPEQYGVYRTLRHLKTGQRINEYDFLWPDEEEYHYYLKSFNWRYRQPNVINTRFIRLSNNDQLCSHNYAAKVYVEAVRVRISQISDIPYPDNLYLLMQALEGYGKVYEHSKYFDVEENQICVDDGGNVKIWVNSDLSINFPNSQTDSKQKGQEDMVDEIVNIVASNTDRDTEPSVTFKEFYNQKRGRGKRFEEAKVLVVSYARLQETEIPNKFEAILNMDKEQPDYSSRVNDSKYQLNSFEKREEVEYDGRAAHGYGYEYYQPSYSEQQRQSYPYQQGQFGLNQAYPTPQYIPHHAIYPPQPIYHQSYVYPPQNNPVFIIPNYPRIEHPLRPVNTINHVLNPFPQALPTYSQAQPVPTAQIDPPQSSNSGLHAHVEQQRSSSNLENMRETIIGSLKEDTGNFQPQKQEHHFQEEGQLQAGITEKENRNTHLRNNSFVDQNNSLSQGDNLVARSLPIKTGYPAQNNQQLSSMAQNNRPIYSHINPKDMWTGNKDGFGLTNNSQLKLKESAHKSKGKVEVNPIKYFYSMDEELEIDPVIAADLAKYLGS